MTGAQERFDKALEAMEAEPASTNTTSTRREERRYDGPIVIAFSTEDPGYMGEPREFDMDGVTYLTVPDPSLWPAASDPFPYVDGIRVVRDTANSYFYRQPDGSLLELAPVRPEGLRTSRLRDGHRGRPAGRPSHTGERS